MRTKSIWFLCAAVSLLYVCSALGFTEYTGQYGSQGRLVLVKEGDPFVVALFKAFVWTAGLACLASVGFLILRLSGVLTKSWWSGRKNPAGGSLQAQSTFPPIARIPAPSAPHSGARQEPTPRATNERLHYARAMAECSENISERDPGLWAQAFAMADGDNDRAQAKYIQLRVADLLAIDSQTEKERNRLELVRLHELHGLQMSEALRVFASRYPVGMYFPALHVHFGHRVTRMSVENDAGYAKRLQYFVREYEKELGHPPSAIARPSVPNPAEQTHGELPRDPQTGHSEPHA